MACDVSPVAMFPQRSPYQLATYLKYPRNSTKTPVEHPQNTRTYKWKDRWDGMGNLATQSAKTLPDGADKDQHRTMLNCDGLLLLQSSVESIIPLFCSFIQIYSLIFVKFTHNKIISRKRKKVYTSSYSWNRRLSFKFLYS